MDTCFDTILIPVDFSMATEAAIEKALELRNSQSTIHLLYVQRHRAVLPVFPASLLLNAIGFFKKKDEAYTTKLLNLKNTIREKDPDVQIELAQVQDVSIKKAVIDKAVNIAADLIILGRNDHAKGLPFFSRPLPAQLAKEVQCAVLTVAPKAMHGAIKTVIVPLIGNATYNKMSAIAALSGNSKLSIHLVTFTRQGGNPAENAPSSLLRLYQWLKTSIQCQVQCKVLPARNKAEATLAYADDVNADLILIDPETQTETLRPDRYITSLLQSKSGIAVLAVQPAGLLVSH